MARCIALLAALAALVLSAVAGAATPARFFAGTPIDGPSADIQALGDLDVARDGTGALAYVKRVAGIDHVGLGSDFDGATTTLFDTSQLALVTDALLQAGFTPVEIEAIMGGNALRVLKAGLPQK